MLSKGPLCEVFPFDSSFHFPEKVEPSLSCRGFYQNSIFSGTVYNIGQVLGCELGSSFLNLEWSAETLFQVGSEIPVPSPPMKVV